MAIKLNVIPMKWRIVCGCDELPSEGELDVETMIVGSANSKTTYCQPMIGCIYKNICLWCLYNKKIINTKMQEKRWEYNRLFWSQVIIRVHQFAYVDLRDMNTF